MITHFRLLDRDAMPPTIISGSPQGPPPSYPSLIFGETHQTLSNTYIRVYKPFVGLRISIFFIRGFPTSNSVYFVLKVYVSHNRL